MDQCKTYNTNLKYCTQKTTNIFLVTFCAKIYISQWWIVEISLVDIQMQHNSADMGSFGSTWLSEAPALMTRWTCAVTPCLRLRKFHPGKIVFKIVESEKTA